MATWYYAERGRQQGPFSDGQFRTLVANGRIQPDTLVWNETLADWQAYSRVCAAPAAGAAAALPPPAQEGDDPTPLRPVAAAATDNGSVSGSGRCEWCSLPFPAEEMSRVGERLVCIGCRPLAMAELSPAVDLPLPADFAGFWIRLGAKIVDALLLLVVVQAAFWLPLRLIGMLGPLHSPMVGHSSFLAALAGGLAQIAVQETLGACYTVFFLGTYAATPGKMLFGLRVVRADGTPISHLRALGRHFAEKLSALLLLIGYIVAAFDDEKRALHDHICDTRVVYRS